MRAHRSSLAGFVLFSLLAACSSSTTTSGTTGAGGSTTATGTGGTGGATTTTATTTTGSGGTTTTTTTTTTTGSGAGGAGTPGDHLLISEVGVSPAGGEFIEIENPTAAPVKLDQYFLSDNSVYHGIAAGQAWNPVTSNPGTDFLAQFPAGAVLEAGAQIVIATDATFETVHGKCPDYILSEMPLTCVNGTAKAMVSPTNGGIGDKKGALLSNDREMVILFQWDGVSPQVKDVDYLTWGAMFEDATRVDKSAVAGYAPDTARASQKAPLGPMPSESIERCGASPEPGEKTSGGNGITGHDETSEDLGASFKAQIKPTPGAKNSCL